MVLIAMPVFGGGSREATDGVTEIRIATQRTSMEGEIREVIAAFEAEYPHIRVSDIVFVTADDWPDYFTSIRTLVAGGNPPDVVDVAIEGIQYMIESGLALPLNPYLDQYPDLKRDYADLHPRLQSAFESDGNIYGFTWDWNNVVVHFNLDMLNEAGLDLPQDGWNKEMFLQYAQALTRTVDGRRIFGVAVPDYYFAVNAWLYNFGASFMTEDLSASALNTPQALEAFQFMWDLVHKYRVAPVPEPGVGFIDQMVNRQVAMTFGGRWPTPAWLENDLNWDIQYLPNFGAQQVIFGSGAWPVLTTSHNPEEAFLLSMFMGSTEGQRILTSLGSIPTRISLMNEILPPSPPNNSMLYRESADIARAVQSPPAYPEIGEIFNRHFSAMMSAEVSVEDAVSAMHREFNAVLQR